MSDLDTHMVPSTWRFKVNPTISQIFQALADVVAEAGPDYRYPEDKKIVLDPVLGPGCAYVADGEPLCVAAKLFVKLGVPVSELAAHEGRRAGQLLNDFMGVQRENPHDVTPLGRCITVAQVNQDMGRTWGDAERSARTEARLSGILP